MHPIPEIYNNFQEVWPQGLGKLTGIGVRQQFLLGQWLRRKYGHFIPETYTSSTYRIKSMKKDRSLMSAMANSAGFYSQSLSPLDEFNVHWSPVPVHILPHPSDFLRGINRCPRLNSLKHLRMHMHDSIKLERQHKSLFTMLTNVTGLHVDRFNIGKLADFLKCMKGSNVSLPGWCTEQVLHEIFEVDNFYWTEKYAKSLEVARLQSGLLFHSIVEHINRIIREKSINLPNNIKMSNKHMMVYSVDDIHVASILTAFRISNNKTIEYASVVSLEVYGPPEPVDASQLIVKLFYKRGWEDENGEYLSMPICYAGEFLDGCPLHVVLERLESLAIHPKYYAVECSPLLAERTTIAIQRISGRNRKYMGISLSS
ncbi:unnamed protein product [Heterobilharzia americana]|nr:unnamed protein product [Heterobilharzia americana]